MSQLGVRVRLATRGAGRWAESSGTNSKFGLNIAELMRMVNELEASGQQAKLVLLHFHIGSQIADIQVLKEATKEVTQIYAELVKRGVGVKYLDVGGGLGVNYDKGHLEEDAGINYSLEEYANAVVFTIKEVCDSNEVPTPTLVTESGRALTAHHSVLVVPVLGAHAKDDPNQDLTGARGRGRARARAQQDPRVAAEDAQAVGAARGVPRRERAARERCASCSRSATCRSRSARSPRASTGASAPVSRAL